MVIDIALMCISLLVIISSIKRGFLSSILGLVAWIVSAILIMKFSMPISEWIYDSFVRERVIKSVAEKISDTNLGNAQATYSAFLATVTPALTAASKLLNVNLITNLDTMNTAGLSTEKVAGLITDNYFSTLILYFVKWIVSIVMFIVLLAILRYISGLIIKLVRVTPFKSADKLLGGVIGVIKAFVVVVVLSAMIELSVGLINGNNTIKSIKKTDYQPKESKYIQMVNESKIVKFMNEESPINKSLYKW